MDFRRLLAMLFAVAMIAAPFGMPAMAAAPAFHHGQMAHSRHCDQQPRQDPHQKSANKDCCAAMCIALVVPYGASNLAQYHPARQRPASDLDRRGYLGEIATPPPRLS